MIENIIPPMMLDASHLVFGDFGANHLPPTDNFFRFVRTGRAVLNGVIILAQINDFLILHGGTLAIPRLLAGRQDNYRQYDYDNHKLFHLPLFFTAKVQFFAITL